MAKIPSKNDSSSILPLSPSFDPTTGTQFWPPNLREQWNHVQNAVRLLQSAGYQALLAGGCVRDYLLKRVPNDFDIATNATPDQVTELFPRALLIGKAFGVTIVPFVFTDESQNFQLEIATFREDLEYKDGRRPEGVRFSTVEADAKRRDFTINALFLDLNSNSIHDYVHGVADLKAGLIRTVGDPYLRFSEDQLRLLRAIRFAVQLDFSIAPETQAAIKALAAKINSVSRERIRDEMLKLLVSERRVLGLQLLRETGLFAELFPRLAGVVESQWDEWLAPFAKANGLAEEGLIALFVAPFLAPFLAPQWLHADEPRFRADLLKEWKIDHQRANSVIFVLRHKSEFTNPAAVRRGQMALLLSETNAPLARKLASLSDPQGQEAREKVFTEIAAQAFGPSGMKPEPLVTGVDVQALGVGPGPKVGQLLREAYLLQLEGKIQTRSDALQWLRENLN